MQPLIREVEARRPAKSSAGKGLDLASGPTNAPSLVTARRRTMPRSSPDARANSLPTHGRKSICGVKSRDASRLISLTSCRSRVDPCLRGTYERIEICRVRSAFRVLRKRRRKFFPQFVLPRALTCTTEAAHYILCSGVRMRTTRPTALGRRVVRRTRLESRWGAERVLCQRRFRGCAAMNLDLCLSLSTACPLRAIDHRLGGFCEVLS